jgi:hypothetical protein
MTTAPTPPLEVFTPVRAEVSSEEPPITHTVVARIAEVANKLFAAVEGAVLPAPEEADVASETIALLGALPLRHARYDNMGGYRLAVNGSFSVRFATDEEWGEPVEDEESMDPFIKIVTSVTIRSDQHGSKDLDQSINAMRHGGYQTPKLITSRHPSLMGVPGTRGRLIWGRRDYTYTTKQQAAVREQIGLVIAQDPTAKTDAHTAIKLPFILPMTMRVGRSLDLRSARTIGRGGAIEPTQPDLVIPTLRVVRELMVRSKQEIDEAHDTTLPDIL